MTSSIFAAVKMAPRDPILGLTEAFNSDPRPNKVNLGVGVYYDDSGKIPLLAACLLYTSPGPRDGLLSRMRSSA